ncbi:MAG TPA: hypothetical protein VIR57_12485 [Chloroflexota bacterium]|jgi:hypothetical protein
MRTSVPRPRRCRATTWHADKPCKLPAAPGESYCPTHLLVQQSAPSLTGGYAAALKPEQRPDFRAAGFVSLADELALARLQLRRLLAANAPGTQVLNGLRTVTVIARLQRTLLLLGRQGKL